MAKRAQSNEGLSSGRAGENCPHDNNGHGGRLSLALVDGDRGIHATVRKILRHDTVAWVMDGYFSGEEAAEQISKAPPHVVLMAVGMPGMTGIECAHQMKLRLPALPVVMHTTRAQPELVLAALRAGARGYVVKTPALTDLVPLLNKAMSGGLALCSNAERLLMEAMQRTVSPWLEWGLTLREGEVLMCLCQHGPEKDVAAAMGISSQTVHVHVRSVYQKLGVHDRKSAVQKYLKSMPGGISSASSDVFGLP